MRPAAGYSLQLRWAAIALLQLTASLLIGGANAQASPPRIDPETQRRLAAVLDDPNYYKMPSGLNLSVPAGLNLTNSAALNYSVAYNETNFQVELYSLFETPTEYRVALQVAVQDIDRCKITNLGRPGCDVMRGFALVLYGQLFDLNATQINSSGTDPTVAFRTAPTASAIILVNNITSSRVVVYSFALKKLMQGVNLIDPEVESAIVTAAWDDLFMTRCIVLDNTPSLSNKTLQAITVAGKPMFDDLPTTNVSYSLQYELTLVEERTGRTFTKFTVLRIFLNNDNRGVISLLEGQQAETSRPLFFRLFLTNDTYTGFTQSIPTVTIEPAAAVSALDAALRNVSAFQQAPPAVMQIVSALIIAAPVDSGREEDPEVQQQAVDQAVDAAELLNDILQKNDVGALAELYDAFASEFGKTEDAETQVVFNANLQLIASNNIIFATKKPPPPPQREVGDPNFPPAPPAIKVPAAVDLSSTFLLSVNSYADLDNVKFTASTLTPADIAVNVPPPEAVTRSAVSRTLPPRPPPRERGLLERTSNSNLLERDTMLLGTANAAGVNERGEQLWNGVFDNEQFVTLQIPADAEGNVAVGGVSYIGRQILQVADRELDWRKTLRIPSADIQDLCASGWVSAAMIVMETALLKQYPKMELSTGLSRQQVINCATTSRDFKSKGCDYGWPQDVGNFAFKYAMLFEEAYPYTGVTGTCSADLLLTGPTARYPNVVRASEPTSAVAYSSSSASLLISALQAGPIVVSFDASGFPFQLYDRGTYSSDTCSDSAFNHAMTLVGYKFNGTTANPTGYWIVRNSFGALWGMQGDAWIKMLPDGTGGMCGMYRYAYAPPRRFDIVPDYLSAASSPPSPPIPAPPPLSPGPVVYNKYKALCLSDYADGSWCLQICYPEQGTDCTDFTSDSKGANLAMWASTTGKPIGRYALIEEPYLGVERVRYRHVQTGFCLTSLDHLPFDNLRNPTSRSWPLAFASCGLSDQTQVFIRQPSSAQPNPASLNPPPISVIISSLINAKNSESTSTGGGVSTLNRCLDGCSLSNILLGSSNAGLSECNRYIPSNSKDIDTYSAAYISYCWATRPSGESYIRPSWTRFQVITVREIGLGVTVSQAPFPPPIPPSRPPYAPYKPPYTPGTPSPNPEYPYPYYPPDPNEPPEYPPFPPEYPTAPLLPL
eukprot:gene30010-18084_t